MGAEGAISGHIPEGEVRGWLIQRQCAALDGRLKKQVPGLVGFLNGQ